MRGKAIVCEVASGRILLQTLPLRESIRKLVWSHDGKLLLVFAPHAVRVYDNRGRIVEQDDPSDNTFDLDAAFVGRTHEVAAIRAAGPSDVFSIQNGRKLFSGTGVLKQLLWSPDGRWLLVTWPTANQWVFVRSGHPRRIVGVSRISSQFGGFPHLDGWCCGG
jgi:hypothetical protein